MPSRIMPACPALALTLVLLATVASVPASADDADWSVVAAEIGRTGELREDTYRLSFPRTDLKVSVDGIPLETGLALGGWAAFARAGGAAVVDGDLVLLPGEIDRVVDALQTHGLAVTALHNHLVGETPPVIYLHFFGTGEAAALARGLRVAVAATAIPPAAAAAPTEPSPPAWSRLIEHSFGRSGRVRGGVLSITVRRPEAIHVHGLTLTPSMGMAHAFNFQEVGAGRVATTGDFVLVDAEVNPVLRALRAGGIGVTALHHHLLHGSPGLVFMHFWAVGEPARIGETLRQALAHAATQHVGGR